MSLIGTFNKEQHVAIRMLAYYYKTLRKVGEGGKKNYDRFFQKEKGFFPLKTLKIWFQQLHLLSRCGHQVMHTFVEEALHVGCGAPCW